ncbi:MAG: translation elongation factor Ts [Planctomycetes bacterium]|nr:translation elongation factor Ts [Planctomycetota bacterium]
MTQIDAKTVKQLRDMTGAPMMDCKSALAETGGDFEKAKEVLRKRGKQVADKASGREVSEGLVYGYTHHNGKVGVLVEIVCETDFVARNEDFQAFCRGVALTVTAYSPAFLDRNSVPADAAANEQRIVTEMTQESMKGKPDNVIEKAVAGRMDKWFAEQTLMEKPYVPDDSKTVEQIRTELVGKIGENIQVRRYVRMELGG